MRLSYPSNKKLKFDVPDFKKGLLNDATTTMNLLNELDYSQISSSIYREVVKRYHLWEIGKTPLPFRNGKFDQFTSFLHKSL